MIELRDCWKAFGKVQALQGVNLRLLPGQTTVLIGPSGCGKSTILRLIIGLVRPDRGQVFFQGREIRSPELLQVRLRMGYVIQNGGLFPHLPARRNITLVARQLGWTPDRMEERVNALSDLTRFPLDGLERYPVQLSGGQRQRVALMRALMLDPEVLLLDEPLGALDPMIRFDLQTDLKDIFQKLGKTAVWVTHDLEEAEFFGDRIVLLKEGRVLQEGSIPDLEKSPADPFVTRFIHAQRRHSNAE